MLFVCKNHVKEGVRQLQAPHIKKVLGDGYLCSFVHCHARAEYKLFSPLHMFHKHIWKNVSNEKI